MVIVWLADSAAYFAGRSFGRHKLAPSISPGKTWEGVAGALLAVTGYGISWLSFFNESTPLILSDSALGAAAILPVLWILAAFSICGDLFESALKRRAGVKDSGKILPGHGGILDRIDALIPVLPMSAILFLL
jgi:phosphatidate cytidylyltransferase